MRAYVKQKIAAGHRLPEYDGPCSRYHGHTWLIEVWLEGTMTKRTGMLVDFKDVKDIINTFDHTTLNDQLPEGWPPTAENFARALYALIPFCVKVRVWESDDAYAEWYEGA